VTPDQAILAAISTDVAAYNDVTIFRLERPRDLRAFAGMLADRPAWNDGKVTPAEWGSLHASYIHNFMVYLRDPDATAFRDARMAQQRRVGTQRRSRY